MLFPLILIMDYDKHLTKRRFTMAKGQIKSNKETKKPKKSKEVVVPNSSIIPMKSSNQTKK